MFENFAGLFEGLLPFYIRNDFFDAERGHGRKVFVVAFGEELFDFLHEAALELAIDALVDAGVELVAGPFDTHEKGVEFLDRRHGFMVFVKGFFDGANYEAQV